MTRRHCEALADEIRNLRQSVDDDRARDVLDVLTARLCARLVAGNPRFSEHAFRNAARDAARRSEVVDDTAQLADPEDATTPGSRKAPGSLAF
jgi:hypothetical protein